MVGSDEPQFHVQVASSPLCSDELQHVLMPHPLQSEDLILVLPRLLVLRTYKPLGQRSSKTNFTSQFMNFPVKVT